MPASLRDLLGNNGDRKAIATFLDDLSPIDRSEAVLSLQGNDVAKLYRAVEGGPTTTIEDFVPVDVPPGRTIIFDGRNSMPVFSRLQKRFARLESGQVVGYNHQAMRAFTGPGYFVVRQASDDADVTGEAWFDYTRAPHDTPRGWPPYKHNAFGISFFVFNRMKDYMRRVATNVFVGNAFKGGADQRIYFALTRES